MCEGTGEVAVYRCPNALVTRDLLDAVDVCVWAERGTLPVAGGLLDQTSHFVKVYPIVVGELGEIRRERAKREREDSQREWERGSR